MFIVFRALIAKVSKVDVNELLSVGKKYVAGLFNDNTKVSIVCHPSKAEEVAGSFKE